jgi:hypothetical protein
MSPTTAPSGSMRSSPDQNRDDIQRRRQPPLFGFADADGGLGDRELGFALIPRLFSPRPARGQNSTAFYAAFCPCFPRFGWWPTGIPCETPTDSTPTYVSTRDDSRRNPVSSQDVCDAAGHSNIANSIDTDWLSGKQIHNLP